jgi:tetratricopeptide (TPR) repeat protein
MATVYLARDLRHDRLVAVKVFRGDLAEGEQAVQFLHEIQIAARLSHPSILPLHDSGEADGILYYVMPYVPGENLGARLRREGALPVDEAIRITRDVAEALTYAHSHDVVHRDIKPENILFQGAHAVVADFGIARAISAVGWAERALPGEAQGTPDYMSPEQVTGHARLDGRSDIYSLGCVLYEMLAGEPPFIGPSLGVTAGHLVDPPPRLTTKRPSLPPGLEEIVFKALAKLPADRYSTAGQFSDALAAIQPSREASRPATRKLLTAIVVVLALVVAGLIFTRPRPTPGPAPDDGLYLVIPFSHRGDAAPQLLTGDQCETLLHVALSRWEDLRIVDPLWVADRRRRQPAPLSLSDGLALARERGAGRLLTGEVWSFRDTIHVRAALYDVSGNGAVIRERQTQIAGDLSDAETRFNLLADSLLIEAPRVQGASGGAMGTRSVAAWRAFDAGHLALAGWDLPGAEKGFRSALGLDAQYALAELWLAQVLSWSGKPVEDWRPLLLGALGIADRLGPPDRAWGQAMVAFAEGRFAESCEKYRAMVARDSLDFKAWFGLGDCQANDPTVVRDAKSASGWSFRSSYQGAINAYSRALTMLPSSYRAFKGVAFERLSVVFFTENNTFRTGFAVERDTLRFGAFPSLAGDTLAFVPYPIGDVVTMKPEAFPTSTAAAVVRNRDQLRSITEAWLAAFPTNPDAIEAHARALESLGELRDDRPPVRSALLLYRDGRSVAADADQRTRLELGQLRVLLKLGRFEAARALADSLLTDVSRASPTSAVALAGAAVLTGRPSQAASLLGRGASTVEAQAPDGTPISVTPALRETWLELLAYASVGAPKDSLTGLEGRMQGQVKSYIAPDRQAEVNDVLLHQVHRLEYNAVGATSSHRAAPVADPLLRLQWMAMQGDKAGVRRQMDEVARLRRSGTPGDVALDATLGEARVRLSIGDTAAATSQLDQVLDALPTLGVALLGDVPQGSIPQAAALPQMLALRAELAAHAGDSIVARTRATQALALWSGAEPALASQVSRLRDLAAGR